MKIKKVRPVLLSAPYAKKGENLEVDLHLSSGYRSTGILELTLEDGTIGLGEAYLAVFAPNVFVEIVKTIVPYVINKEFNNIEDIMKTVSLVTGYWSYQGAAQHVVSAFDIALHDCKGKLLGLPVYKLYNSEAKNTIRLYGSGGDSTSPKYLKEELDYLNRLGINYFKIRARINQINKTLYAVNEGKKQGVRIAVDMTQNLVSCGNSIEDILAYFKKIKRVIDPEFFFFEEVLGIYDGHLYPELRKKLRVKIAGGEIVTNCIELNTRIKNSWYDIVQPDASVIGGISAVCEIFKKARVYGTEVFVHCWGGAVSMAANYHAALASGGTIAEWPMPTYSLRDAMIVEPWSIDGGILKIGEVPGLGVQLSPEIESEFQFREDAIYSCVPQETVYNDEIWNIAFESH